MTLVQQSFILHLFVEDFTYSLISFEIFHVSHLHLPLSPSNRPVLHSILNNQEKKQKKSCLQQYAISGKQGSVATAVNLASPLTDKPHIHNTKTSRPTDECQFEHLENDFNSGNDKDAFRKRDSSKGRHGTPPITSKKANANATPRPRPIQVWDPPTFERTQHIYIVTQLQQGVNPEAQKPQGLHVRENEKHRAQDPGYVLTSKQHSILGLYSTIEKANEKVRERQLETGCLDEETGFQKDGGMYIRSQVAADEWFELGVETWEVDEPPGTGQLSPSVAVAKASPQLAPAPALASIPAPILTDVESTLEEEYDDEFDIDINADLKP